MATKMNRKGISNVVATIILIAVAIALAVAVAVWVFGLAGSASKTSTLQIQALGLSGVGNGSNTSPYLVILVSNPSSSGVGINGFTLGSLSCVFQNPVSIAAGTQGGNLTIALKTSGGYFVTGSSAITVYYNGAPATTGSCSGQQSAQVGIQYSGYLTTVSGQTYPFTVTATS